MREVREIMLEGAGLPVIREDGTRMGVKRITFHDGSVEWVEGTFMRDGVPVTWQGYPEELREATELEKFLAHTVGLGVASRLSRRVGAGQGRADRPPGRDAGGGRP